MNHSTPGLLVHHQLLEFTQTHVLCCLLLILPSNFPSIRVFSSESALCIRWPKYWSFSCHITPSNEHPRLISFRMDWLESSCSPRDSQESSPTPQFKSIKSSVLRFTVQLSHPYMTTGKTTALTRWTFADKLISLLLTQL